MKVFSKQLQIVDTAQFSKYQIELGLFIVGLLVRVLVGFGLHQPGYPDAYYYYQIAANFHAGHGLTELSLWNYQVDSFGVGSGPLGLEHPAFAYWLPLSTGLMIFSFALFGVSWWAAQLPFILLAACLPPLAFRLGRQLFGPNQRRYSWAMALVVLFPGRYFLFLNAPDNFAPFALIVILGLMCIYKGLTDDERFLWLAGILSGFAYLSRSDGILLIGTLVICFGWRRWQLRSTNNTNPPRLLNLVIALALALLVVAPWLWRNLATFGAIIPSASTKVLFMRDYNELFSYELPLDFNYYVNSTLPTPQWGIGPLLGTKFTALWLDLVLLSVEGLFLLGPLFLFGLLCLRKRSLPNSYLAFGVYFGLLYVLMVLVFTFAGEHGTIFHSAGGLLPFQAGAVVAALDAITAWYARRRKRVKPERLRLLFLGTLLLANSVLTLYVAYGNWQTWDDDYHYGQTLGEWFKQNKLDSNVIIVGEPLSYSYASGQEAIPLASDGVEANLKAAHQYGAKYLALGQVHYSSLDGLYRLKSAPGLVWLTTLTDGTEIYQIT